jgi:DNA repair exonuclease SbcCD ATPase subunit
MKKILFIFCLTLIISSPIYAQDGNTPQTNRQGAVEARVTEKAERKEGILTTAVTRLQEKANKEIERRIASLTKLMEKINAVKRLTDAQKTTMVGQVQAEIDSLTALKTTIAGQTDIAALRTSVQSIVKSYRIYVLYIPKLTIIANADKILNLIEGEMTTLTAKLQLRIDEAKGKGYTVETMTSLMAERKIQVDEAKTLATNAINTVTVLTPDGWPGNKTQLQEARDMLKTARKNLNDAQKFASQVRVQLGQLKPTGSPKPTP